MKKIIALAMVAFLLPGVSMARGAWGALAYDKYSGAAGYSWNHYTSYSARNAAMRQCGRYRCRVLTTFRNSCVALAQGRGAYGWATHPDRIRARINARRQCRLYGGRGCRIRVTKCSWGRGY